MAEQDFKFLAIKNWSKRQSTWTGKREWIRDYTDKDADEDYEKLTFFQRQVLDGCRRLRGRLGKNIPNDCGFIARALHASRKDTPHIPHAVRTLTARGLLLLTNQQLDSLDIDIEEDIDKEKNKPSARKARGAAKHVKKTEIKTDERFTPFVDILHRYWKKFSPNVRFELWFDAAGGKQLKNILARHKSMTLDDFTQCVANRARSPGAKHEEPFYLWGGHILEWLSGAKGTGDG